MEGKEWVASTWETLDSFVVRGLGSWPNAILAVFLLLVVLKLLVAPRIASRQARHKGAAVEAFSPQRHRTSEFHAAPRRAPAAVAPLHTNPRPVDRSQPLAPTGAVGYMLAEFKRRSYWLYGFEQALRLPLDEGFLVFGREAGEIGEIAGGALVLAVGPDDAFLLQAVEAGSWAAASEGPARWRDGRGHEQISPVATLFLATQHLRQAHHAPSDVGDLRGNSRAPEITPALFLQPGALLDGALLEAAARRGVLVLSRAPTQPEGCDLALRELNALALRERWALLRL